MTTARVALQLPLTHQPCPEASKADGALEAGRYLTNELIDGSVLGEWRARLRVSPYFPVGTTYRDMLLKGRRAAYLEDSEEDNTIAGHAGVPAFGQAGGREHDHRQITGGDPLTFGTGVVASFLARVLKEDRVEIRLSHPVTELLRDDDGRVVGVRAEGPQGPVEFRGPVVLATSTYDWDPELVREFLGLDPEDFGSVAPESLRGHASRGGSIPRAGSSRSRRCASWARRSASTASNWG